MRTFSEYRCTVLYIVVSRSMFDSLSAAMAIPTATLHVMVEGLISGGRLSLMECAGSSSPTETAQ